MRLKSYKSFIFLFLLILTKILVFCYFTRLISGLIESTIEEKLVKPTLTKPPRKKISELVTVLIREFEQHENDITLTSHSFVNLFATMELFIIYDELPYPPPDIMLNNNTSPNIKFVKLSPELRTNFADSYPISKIRTKYVLIVPDSTRLTSRQSLQTMVQKLSSNPGSIVVTVVNNHKNNLSCLRMNINLREWTLKYDLIKSMICDGVSGKHVMLLETETLKKVSNAFLLPFPHSLYLQTASLDLKVCLNLVFQCVLISSI